MPTTTNRTPIILLLSLALVTTTGFTTALANDNRTTDEENVELPNRTLTVSDAENGTLNVSLERSSPNASDQEPAVVTMAPPGLGPDDPWVDANGDEMFGALEMGPNVIRLNGRAFGATLDGDLQFAGDSVCLQDAGNCAGQSISGETPIVVDGSTILLSTQGCADGELWKWTGSTWDCQADLDTTYDGTDFALSDQGCASGDVVAGVTTDGSLVCVEDAATTISSIDWSNITDKPTGFADDVDNDTTYDGTDFALSDQACSGEDVVAGVNASGGIQCVDVSSTDTLAALDCASDEITRYDGTTWVCSTDQDTTYNGSDFALSDQSCASREVVAGVDAFGTIECVTDQNTDSDTLGALDCRTREITMYNGSAWVCSTDRDTTYSAGDGLELDGTTFNLTQACASDEILKYGRSGWTCSTDQGTTYSAGDGLELDGTTFNLTQACASDEILKYDGSTWTCSTDQDTDTTYQAGEGLELNTSTSPSSFQLTTSCSEDQVLKHRDTDRDGTADEWVCAVDDFEADTTAGAGAGLSDDGSGNHDVNAADGLEIAKDHVLLTQACASDEILKYDGINWVCSVDEAGASDVWRLGGNAGLTGGEDFLGTTDATNLTLKVDGTQVATFVPTSGTPNVLAGNASNTVASGVQGAVVAGGERNQANADYATIAGGGPVDPLDPSPTHNTIFDDHGTIAGGGNNTAGVDDWQDAQGFAAIGGGQDNYATSRGGAIGGGSNNTAGPSPIGDPTVPETEVCNGIDDDLDGQVDEGLCTFAGHATVAGGKDNVASGELATVSGGISNTASGANATVGGGSNNAASDDNATVGGGYANTASGTRATVGGGDSNIASGLEATVPGGDDNEASGSFSFAAGAGATAQHSGTFVWSDGTDTSPDAFASTGSYQFLVDASGGVGIGTNSPTEELTVANNIALGAGSGSDDDVLAFDGGNEYLRWLEDSNQFQLSDDLNLTGDGDLRSDGILETHAPSDSERFADTDDSNSFSEFEWFYNGTEDFTANKVMKLEQDGDLFIPGTMHTAGGSFDVAESYRQAEPVAEGELVRVDPADPTAVRKADVDHPGMLGIVSTEPGVLLGGPPMNLEALEETWGPEAVEDYEAQRPVLEQEVIAEHPELTDWLDSDDEETVREAEGTVEELTLERFSEDYLAPVALSGRVPTQAATTNGPIEAGDSLTVSEVPGVAEKADPGDPVVGTALEGLELGTGTIEVFVSSGPGNADVSELETTVADQQDRIDQLEKENDELRQRLDAIEERLDKMEE